MNEETVIIIETTETKTLCFTTDRMIVAEVGAPGDAATASFAPFAVLLAELMRHRKMRRLRKLSPENILTADRKNFVVSYAEISKVELFRSRPGLKVRITASASTYEFLLAKPKKFQSYVNDLRFVLAGKLAVKDDARKPSRRPSRSDLQVDLFKAVLMALGAAIFMWLILNGVAGGYGRHPVAVGILAFCGALIGAGIGYGWASKVSGWRRLMSFLVMASLGAAVWASVPLGFLGAVSATGIVAVLLVLSWLRFWEHFRWPW